MLIAARAIGASRGYIYVRAEYPLAVKTLRCVVCDKNGACDLQRYAYQYGVAETSYAFEPLAHPVPGR
jgi:NADH:ubiquinone oxidoreductase subunit F (NADH-binding)